MAGPSDTLESPWPPLAIRPCPQANDFSPPPASPPQLGHRRGYRPPAEAAPPAPQQLSGQQGTLGRSQSPMGQNLYSISQNKPPKLNALWAAIPVPAWPGQRWPPSVSLQPLKCLRNVFLQLDPKINRTRPTVEGRAQRRDGGAAEKSAEKRCRRKAGAAGVRGA
jgi:hypothetical protein